MKTDHPGQNRAYPGSCDDLDQEHIQLHIEKVEDEGVGTGNQEACLDIRLEFQAVLTIVIIVEHEERPDDIEHAGRDSREEADDHPLEESRLQVEPVLV